MRRLQLREIHDHPRFPSALRNLVTDALEALWQFGNSYRPILGRLHAALALGHVTPVPVVDLCSGGGGPWLRLSRQLDQEYHCPVAVCLTDKFPNRQAIARLRTRDAAASIDFETSPVDAMQIPARLGGYRTMFSAFHHFDPLEARAILASAASNRRGIGVFEVAQRDIKTMAVLCLTPLLVLLLTPAIRPFRWSRLFWTYAIPVVPFVIWFDGWVSCLRAYSEVELHEIVSGIESDSAGSTYRWEIGKATSGFLPVTYVLGHPEPFLTQAPVRVQTAVANI